MGLCEEGLQSSGKGLGMEGREVDCSSSSRRSFWAGDGGEELLVSFCALP